MLNVKHVSCKYQLLKLVQLGQGIEPSSTNYEVDALGQYAPVIIIAFDYVQNTDRKAGFDTAVQLYFDFFLLLCFRPFYSITLERIF